MATVTPTFTQVAPVGNKKIMFFTVASASASDTFSVSSYFSSVDFAAAYRTPATGTAVTCTISATTITLGAGPSSETVSGFIVGTG